MPTTWKCPYVFSGCLPGEDNSIGNTEAERIDVSIPEPVSACAEHLHRRVLVAMNGDDHTLEHLLCLLGITGARNGDRAHCQAEKQRNKASHSGILLYNLTKGTRDRRLAQAVDARRRAFHNHPFCESAREQRSTRLTDEGTVQRRRGVARPRRMRGFCSDPGNFWFDGSAWWRTQSGSNPSHPGRPRNSHNNGNLQRRKPRFSGFLTKGGRNFQQYQCSVKGNQRIPMGILEALYGNANARIGITAAPTRSRACSAPLVVPARSLRTAAGR